MIKKWRDYFGGECDACGESISKEGILYVLNESMGVCIDCYEDIKIYIVREEIYILERLS